MTSKRPPRNLFLHLSALSDSEYSTYVEALSEIVDDGEVDGESGAHARLSDGELETRRVSLPVVRAWMKGRFRDLGPGEIDKASVCDCKSLSYYTNSFVVHTGPTGLCSSDTAKNNVWGSITSSPAPAYACSSWRRHT